jgi:GT2 family glycosyltransferase
MSADLISVIIPTYNRAHCIAFAIDSAVAQTHANLEIIVVDDGSSDDTGALIARRYAADPRIVYLRQENNKGVAAARNRGLRAARGDYIAFLDSDDVWKAWKIELQLACLKHFPQAGMIWTDFEAVGPDGRLLRPRFLRTMYRASYRWFPTSESLFPQSELLEAVLPTFRATGLNGRVFCGDISSQMIMGNLVHTSTVLLRRARLEQVGTFDETLKPAGEDFDFHLRTCRAGQVTFADVPSTSYRTGAVDQLSRPEYGIHIAQNFLKTIEPVIKGSRPINLPPSMIADVQAQAHAWIGRELLALGDRKGAREHLLASLHHRAFTPYAMAFLILSCGPSFTFPIARAVIRAAKTALRLAKGA